ncbi:hypothetical protein GCM10010317_092820 [Streptomyces mirabilis]|nr:hypothetical protein GCM10010317_092820 [Streptomyces mirabilis]
MNVQVIADPYGKLLWAPPALPGAAHDIKAARTHGIIDALIEAGLASWADKGYQGAGGTVRVPFRGRWDRLSTVSTRGQRRARQYPDIRRAGHGDPEDLAPAAETPRQHHPNHQPRPSRPHLPPDLLKLRLAKAHWMHSWGTTALISIATSVLTLIVAGRCISPLLEVRNRRFQRTVCNPLSGSPLCVDEAQ